MLSTDNVYELINYTAFVESLFIAISVAGLLYLRYKQPNRERPIKVSKQVQIPIIICADLHIFGGFLFYKSKYNDQYLVFNTDSAQDTANTHTNKMGDFIDPLCFGRALPPNYSPHRIGINGPPQGALWSHIALIQGKMA